MKQSAGILLYRDLGPEIEVLLVHPGGPFWARKDAGAWSIPKGEFLEGEEPFAAAQREFAEEMGLAVPAGKVTGLGSIRQSSSKIVVAWAVAADMDITHIKSNMFDLEWPPKTGQMKQFPEIDKAGWFTLDIAQARIVKGQVALLQKLADALGIALPPATLPENLKVWAQPANTAPKKADSRTEEQTSLF